MTNHNEVLTAEAAYKLPDATWVVDATDKCYCLINTHMGFPQRMAMSLNGRSLDALETLAYPLALAEVDGECAHGRGTWELGHCERCGQVVAEPRPMFIDLHLTGTQDD